MQFPAQKPRMMAITTETTIINPTNIVVQALVGEVSVTGAGTITIPEGNAISLRCDIGNTLGDIVVNPTGTAQVIYFT